MHKLALLLIICFSLSSDLNAEEENEIRDDYFGIGFLDHKTGLSLLSFTSNIYSENSHEIFFGFGSALAINTLASGYKYTYETDFVDLYSVFALHLMFGMGGELIAPFASAGIEKELFDNIYINFGTMVHLRIYHPRSDTKVEFLSLPFPNINLNYRY